MALWSDGARVQVLGREIDVRSCGGGAGPHPRLVVRPGQLRLASGSDDVIMPAEVIDVVYLGDTTQVKCRTPGVGEIIARIDPLQMCSQASGSDWASYRETRSLSTKASRRSPGRLPASDRGRAGLQLERTRRMPLSELVLEQLLGQLRSGTIRPGDRLPGEHDLMRMLGVGRSSVREALRWLITLGVVETKAGRGAVIVARSPVPFPQSDVTDVFQKWAVLDLLEVRESLEGQAAALAARRATALDLATLERHALEIERLVAERRTYFRANAAFHAAVARASHNNVLAGCVERLVGQVRLYRQRLMREIQGMPEGDVAEHQAVLDAIRACEPERARTAMIAHIRRFAGVVRALDQPSGRGHPAREGDGHPRATVGAPDRRGRVREHTDRP